MLTNNVMVVTVIFLKLHTYTKSQHLTTPPLNPLIATLRCNQWEVAEGIAQICNSDAFEPTRIASTQMEPLDYENMKTTISENGLDTQAHYLRDKVVGTGQLCIR